MGIGTLLFIGPVLIYLIQSSLNFGFKGGLVAALGIITGDIIYVIALFHGSDNVLSDWKAEFTLSIAGALILLFFSVKYILFQSDIEKSVKPQPKNLLVVFTNSFLINLINPFVFAVWLGFISFNRSMYNDQGVILSLITTLLVIFGTDCLKAYFAAKIDFLVHSKLLSKIYTVFGIAFFLFSMRMIIHAYNLYAG